MSIDGKILPLLTRRDKYPSSGVPLDRARRKSMRTSSTRLILMFVKVAVFAGMMGLLILTETVPATAQATKVKVGRTIGGSGFHIPSYVAMDKGFFKAEGLDAEFIAATAGVLVRAAIAKEIEYVPIPGGGSEAMLK